MDFPFTFSDLQHFIAIKFIFYAFIALGLLGIYKKWKAEYFVGLAAATCAASYFILVDNLGLMFWGLKADEITIAAMYQHFAHGNFWGDFNYMNLPPFYPSLFFQVVAAFGKLFNWNGVQMAKFGAGATMFLFPIALFYFQKYIWNKKHNELKPHTLAWMLGTLFVFLLAGWDAIITKPYELVSATSVILWSVFLMIDIHEEKLNIKKVIAYGVTGGFLFWMFYFWFFLAALGIAVFNFISTKKVVLRAYMQLVTIGAIILLVASPFWIPLARSYAEHGAENWQLGFFTIEWIASHVPTISFSANGIIALLGLAALIIYRHVLYMRALGSLLIAGFAWQVMGLTTIFFFASPLQESKGFLFFSTSIFAFAAAYGIEKWWTAHSHKLHVHQKTASALLLIIIAPLLLFGTFVDSKEVQDVRVRARSLKPEQKEVVEFLRTQNTKQITILTSGIPELHAFVPFTEFIYFNQHNSHPAALFSERHAFVEELARSSSSTDLYDTIRTSHPRIDLVILYKGGEKIDAYPVYFNLDQFPNRMKEETLYITKSLFAKNYFEIIFENDAYITYRVK